LANHSDQVIGMEAEGTAELNWHALSVALLRKRIPMARAIFDTTKCKVVFPEDLFAEPSRDEHFGTDDVAGFLKAQRATLAALAASSKQPKIQMVDWHDCQTCPPVPRADKITAGSARRGWSASAP
jgi:hypothetical protein